MNISNDKLREFYTLYADTVYRICFLYMKNASDAEDALQETFIRLIKNSGKIKDNDHVKPWLICVSKNICRDMLKKHSRFAEVPLSGMEISEDSILDIGYMVQSLSPKYKLPLYLHYFEGMTYNEISASLHISVSAVKSRIYRARQELKLIIEEESK